MKKQNELSLGQALQAWLQELQLKDKLMAVKIEQIWLSEFGATIAKATTKLFVEKRIVYLYINSATIRHQISYSKDNIIATLNRQLGESFVKDIEVR